MNSSFIPCVGGISFFIVLFGFILLWRLISFRETMALAEKGLVRPEKVRGDGKDTLRWGVVITAIGLALSLGLWPLGLMGQKYSFPLGLGPWMLIGFIPTFFGLALILIYILTREEKPKEKPSNPASDNLPNEKHLPD